MQNFQLSSANNVEHWTFGFNELVILQALIFIFSISIITLSDQSSEEVWSSQSFPIFRQGLKRTKSFYSLKVSSILKSF